jgi:hypothetical protein
LNTAPFQHPAAFLPLVMSFTALVVVLGHAALYGIVHEADEGSAAHIFQLLMVAQVPLVAWFAVRWLPRSPSVAARVLVMQALAAAAAFATVYFLT